MKVEPKVMPANVEPKVTEVKAIESDSTTTAVPAEPPAPSEAASEAASDDDTDDDFDDVFSKYYDDDSDPLTTMKHVKKRDAVLAPPPSPWWSPDNTVHPPHTDSDPAMPNEDTTKAMPEDADVTDETPLIREEASSDLEKDEQDIAASTGSDPVARAGLVAASVAVPKVEVMARAHSRPQPGMQAPPRLVAESHSGVTEEDLPPVTLKLDAGETTAPPVITTRKDSDADAAVEPKGVDSITAMDDAEAEVLDLPAKEAAKKAASPPWAPPAVKKPVHEDASPPWKEDPQQQPQLVATNAVPQAAAVAPVAPVQPLAAKPPVPNVPPLPAVPPPVAPAKQPVAPVQPVEAVAAVPPAQPAVAVETTPLSLKDKFKQQLLGDLFKHHVVDSPAPAAKVQPPQPVAPVAPMAPEAPAVPATPVSASAQAAQQVQVKQLKQVKPVVKPVQAKPAEKMHQAKARTFNPIGAPFTQQLATGSGLVAQPSIDGVTMPDDDLQHRADQAIHQLQGFKQKLKTDIDATIDSAAPQPEAPAWAMGDGFGSSDPDAVQPMNDMQTVVAEVKKEKKEAAAKAVARRQAQKQKHLKMRAKKAAESWALEEARLNTRVAANAAIKKQKAAAKAKQQEALKAAQLKNTQKETPKVVSEGLKIATQMESVYSGSPAPKPAHVTKNTAPKKEERIEAKAQQAKVEMIATRKAKQANKKLQNLKQAHAKEEQQAQIQKQLKKAHDAKLALQRAKEEYDEAQKAEAKKVPKLIEEADEAEQVEEEEDSTKPQTTFTSHDLSRIMQNLKKAKDTPTQTVPVHATQPKDTARSLTENAKAKIASEMGSVYGGSPTPKSSTVQPALALTQQMMHAALRKAEADAQYRADSRLERPAIASTTRDQMHATLSGIEQELEW